MQHIDIMNCIGVPVALTAADDLLAPDDLDRSLEFDAVLTSLEQQDVAMPPEDSTADHPDEQSDDDQVAIPETEIEQDPYATNLAGLSELDERPKWVRLSSPVSVEPPNDASKSGGIGQNASVEKREKTDAPQLMPWRHFGMEAIARPHGFAVNHAAPVTGHAVDAAVETRIVYPGEMAERSLYKLPAKAVREAEHAQAFGENVPAPSISLANLDPLTGTDTKIPADSEHNELAYSDATAKRLMRVRSEQIPLKPTELLAQPLPFAATEVAGLHGGTVFDEPEGVLTSQGGVSDAVIPAPSNPTPRTIGPVPTAIVQSVGQQLAFAVNGNANGRTEVVLNPVELGRVEMKLLTQDAGVLVQIVIERSDTQDLIRRHLDTFAQEFRQMGFRDVSFEFGGDARHPHQSDLQQQIETRAADEKSGGVQPQLHEKIVGLTDGGLDIRL